MSDGQWIERGTLDLWEERHQEQADRILKLEAQVGDLGAVKEKAHREGYQKGKAAGDAFGASMREYVERLEAQVGRATVSEAARVLLNVFEDPDNYAPDDFDWQLLYGEMTADHKENLEICGVPDWPATLTVGLRILAQEQSDDK